MQHNTQEQSRAASSLTYAVPTSTAHSLSPPADVLQITDSADSASNAILTPRFNPAPPGTERLASATVSIDGSASQRLSAVISAPPTVENVEHRDTDGAQLTPQPAPEREESPGRAALALRSISQRLRAVMPAFTDLMIHSPPSQKPVPHSPPSSLDNSLPQPDLSLQLAVQDRVKLFNRPDSSQATAPRSLLQIADRRPVPQMQFNDTTRRQHEYYRCTTATVPTLVRGQSSGSLMMIRTPRLLQTSVSSWKVTSCTF